MKVLYFSYAYPNSTQPTLGTFNRSLLAALSSQHDIRVVAPVPFPQIIRSRLKGTSPSAPGFQAIPGVEADYVPFYYPPKVMRDRFDEFLWWSVREQLERTIREFRPDVILSYWAHPDGAVAVRAGRAQGIPVVTIVGGSDVLLLARSGRRRTSILNALHQADAVVAVSRHIAETLIADGLPAENVHVVRRGIDRTIFRPGDRADARRELGLAAKRFTLISVGRLESVKGQTHLIEACHQLFREGHSFAAHLLGGGPLAQRLKQEIRHANLQGTVTLHGSQPQAVLANWYRAADVTVLPSLSEGIPNVLLESMACGTPFVASNVGGIPEIVDERYDDLVSPADAAALAMALRRRLTTAPPSTYSPESRRFEPGSWEDSAAALCDVFASVGVRTSEDSATQVPTIHAQRPVLQTMSH